MGTTKVREAKRSLEAGILALPEEDLTERLHSKVFVEVPGGFGPNCREIGELFQAEMKALEPGLRIRVVNCLHERYVAEQGRLDLLVGRHPPYQGHTGHRCREPSLCGSGLRRHLRSLCNP